MGINKNKLTNKQQKLLNFYSNNWKITPPTYQEMADYFNIKKQTVFCSIRLIENKLGSIVSIGRRTLRNQGDIGSNPIASTISIHRFEQQEWLGIDNYGESNVQFAER